MRTIVGLRTWIIRRVFRFGTRGTGPCSVGDRYRPTLHPLEDRRLPGDVLWSALTAAHEPAVMPDLPTVSYRNLYRPIEVGRAAGVKAGVVLDDVRPPRVGTKAILAQPFLAVTPKSGLSADDAIGFLLPGFGGVATEPGPSPRGRPVEVPATPVPALQAPPLAGVPPAFVQIAAPQATEPSPLLFAPRSATSTRTPDPNGVEPQSAEATSLSAPAAPIATRGASRFTLGRDLTVPTTNRREKPADFSYHIPGGVVGLNVKPDRIAVQLTDPSGAGLAALTSAGGPLAGATFVRWVRGSELAVLEGAGLGARAGVVRDPAVAYTVPVYAGAATGTEEVVVNEVIVKLADWENAGAFFSANGFESYRGLDGTYDVFVATVAGYGRPVLDAVTRLGATPGVVYAEPNGYQDLKLQYDPNDPQYTSGNMWHVKNTGQGGGQAGADVNLTKAWDVNPGGSANMVFAAVDEGIDMSHEDLTPWVNPGEIPGDKTDNDGNGWVDDVNGWNFVGNNNSVTPQGVNQDHGTAVAGLLAAKGDNGIGVVAGSYKAKVMSARIFAGSSVATDADIAGAIYYAAGKTKSGLGTWTAARVLNNSWGGGSPSVAINDAITWAAGTAHTGVGVPVFFAAGNDGAPFLLYPQSQALTTPGMITVGMMGNTGLPSYNSYGDGLDLITVSDGGTLLVNTTDRTGPSGYASGNYTGTGATGFGGTSAASPIAASIGGLVLSQAAAVGVTFSAAQLDAYLHNNTDLVGGALIGPYDTATGFNPRYGAGRLNAFDAVNNVGRAEADVVTATAKVASGSTQSFAATGIGDSTVQTFRVRNGGTKELDLSGLTISGATYALAAGFNTTKLGLGESATFAVKFSPTAAAAATGSATFTTNDTDEGTYTINFTGTGKFISAGGRTFEDWNGNGTRDVNDPGIPGRTVFVDLNNNGTVDLTPNAFTSSPGLAISDLKTTVATQTVSGLTGPAVDVNVTLNITHTWDSDLRAFLVNPAGTRVELFSGVGADGDNFTNTTLDDEATQFIEFGTAPFTGSFVPFGSMAAFDGDAGNGTWQLEVFDVYPGDTGTLNSWTLTISTGEQNKITDANGDYRFYGLDPGPNVVRQIVPAGWTATTPPATVNVVSNASNTTTDFGSGFNNSFYTNVYNDLNGNGSKNAGEPGLAGRRVFLDENGNGTFDTGGNKTGSNSTPLGVPDGTATFVFSDITISGAAPGGVADVDVTLTITHTWDADLYVFLIGPDGRFIRLFGNVGADGDNFTNTTLDDEAATAITAGAAPFTGSFRPEGPLSFFDGGPANGTWSLALADVAPTDVGTLQNWSLDIDLGERYADTDSLGNAFVDLTAGGPYTFKIDPPPGFVYTAPADGKYVVTAAGAPLFNNYYGVAVPPSVTATPVVNGGAAQRSRVTSVTVTFNSPVTLAAGAFTFTRVGTYDGAAGDNATISSGGASPQVSVATSVNGSGNTVATLTFTGTGAVEGTSLADGVWKLTVDKTKVSLGLLNPAADYVTPTTGAGRIFRLFGDISGDGQVNFTGDYTLFDAAFGSALGDSNYLAPFDANNDNQITFTGDYVPFDANFGRTM